MKHAEESSNIVDWKSQRRMLAGAFAMFASGTALIFATAGGLDKKSETASSCLSDKNSGSSTKIHLHAKCKLD